MKEIQVQFTKPISYLYSRMKTFSSRLNLGKSFGKTSKLAMNDCVFSSKSKSGSITTIIAFEVQANIVSNLKKLSIFHTFEVFENRAVFITKFPTLINSHYYVKLLPSLIPISTFFRITTIMSRSLILENI